MRQAIQLIADVAWWIASFILAIAAGILPRRWWPSIETWVPVSRNAGVSGIATILVACFVAIPAYFRYMEAYAGVFGALTPILFVLSTPLGFWMTYLTFAGLFRAVSAYADDARGDPILTLVDSIIWKQRRTSAARRVIRGREELEGPEVPDRLVTGKAGGFPDADFVVVASRRKPGWERGVFVITPDVWYRLGTPTEMTIHGGLRTLYPLSEIRDLEVVRKSVEYVLPPLSGSLPRSAEKVDA